MSYLYLLLSLLSSLSIAILLKIYEQKKNNRTIIIASNYIVAGTLGYFLSQKAQLTPVVLTFGAIVGLFFFIGFLLLSLAVKKKGVASSVTIGRLSLAIPVGLSILFWGETPILIDIIALLSIFIIIISWEGKVGKISPILLAIFFVFGLLDSALKYFKLKFPLMDDGTFLVILFFSAMIWSWSYILVSRQKILWPEIYRGLILGIPNFFSSYFLLKALAIIPAYIVFPFVNIGLIIFSAFCGKLFFKEELTQKKVLLIVVGVIAVLVLSV